MTDPTSRYGEISHDLSHARSVAHGGDTLRRMAGSVKWISDGHIAGDLARFDEGPVAEWVLASTTTELIEVAAVWGWIEHFVTEREMRTGRSFARRLPISLALAIAAIFVKEGQPRFPHRIRRRADDAHAGGVLSARRPDVQLLRDRVKQFTPPPSLESFVATFLDGNRNPRLPAEETLEVVETDCMSWYVVLLESGDDFDVRGFGFSVESGVLNFQIAVDAREAGPAPLMFMTALQCKAGEVRSVFSAPGEGPASPEVRAKMRSWPIPGLPEDHDVPMSEVLRPQHRLPRLRSITLRGGHLLAVRADHIRFVDGTWIFAMGDEGRAMDILRIDGGLVRNIEV